MEFFIATDPHDRIEALSASVLFATSMPDSLRVGAGLPGVIIACILLSIGSGSFKVAAIPFMGNDNSMGRSLKKPINWSVSRTI